MPVRLPATRNFSSAAYFRLRGINYRPFGEIFVNGSKAASRSLRLFANRETRRATGSAKRIFVFHFILSTSHPHLPFLRVESPRATARLLTRNLCARATN